MSSNFLNKSGLSYFYGKIKEMLQNKQDKLTPGTGITIQNNVISASGGSNKQNLYVYDIEQKILQTQGYRATVKSNGTDVQYSGYNAWSLKIKKQRVLAPEFTQDNPYPVTLACVLIVGDNTYGCSIPCYFTSYVNNVDAGTATVTVKGAGNYAGATYTKTFEIRKADLSAIPAKDITVADTTYSKDLEDVSAYGKTIKPAVTVNCLFINGAILASYCAILPPN